MNQLPNDPIILLSVVNTKLRDLYPSIESLCDDMNENIEEITDKLSQIGYEYDKNTNQFK